MTHQRQIKFRVFDIKYQQFSEEPFFRLLISNDGKIYNTENDEWTNPGDRYLIDWFTGLHDKHGKEVYESDIFRVEEDNIEDMIYYIVIVWVQEWCMFCTLTVNEYHAYQTEGIKALDEPLFWTYTLEDTNDRRFFLCGNLHSNPELLKP